MENQIKVSEDLLLEIQSLRDELTQNVVRIGRLNVQLSFYEKDMEIIKSELKKLYDEAADISIREDKLQDKVSSIHGSGRLDFETGVFTKAS